MHAAGETTSEMLDWVPAQFRVLRIRRPKWACTDCGTLKQAPAPERAIGKGLATPALLAHVLISRYCDHTPLYLIRLGWRRLLVAGAAPQQAGRACACWRAHLR
jgi:transposase